MLALSVSDVTQTLLPVRLITTRFKAAGALMESDQSPDEWSGKKTQQTLKTADL